MRPRNLAAVVAFALLAAFAANAKSAEDALRAADAQWEKAVSTGDIDGSVNACADDGSVLSQGAPIATGHDAIRKLFGTFFSMPEIKLGWQITKAEAARSGDMGYTTGTYTMSYKDPSGKTATDHGKYVTVWKKQKDGSWKVAYDIFNSDLPAAP
jgi:uncharacterized protein (TIGR02246 family)